MFRIDLNSDTLENAMKGIDTFCKKHIPDNDLLFKVRLIYEEIMTNMFRHAVKLDTTFVEVGIKTSPNSVRLSFLYDGDEFDPTKYKDDRINEPLKENTKEGGFGLFLVTNMAKSFSYKRENGFNRIEIEISNH
ncbi:ATP-binding protein [Hippea sp. KM1]|uniref:ATP-binding protein n=1 Tax=Hippea sp. KM1 TaxID=944481 RepID=UPI00046D5B23|nr:ATP-binding protein [Hippea sp. KM1]